MDGKKESKNLTPTSILTQIAPNDSNFSHAKFNKNKYPKPVSTPVTPFEVIHEDLEMYRAIVDAFKLLSSKHDEQKDDRKERQKDTAQKHMKRLSLIAIGFDEQLAEMALEQTHYDINAAVEYCQHQQPKSTKSPTPYENKQDNYQHM
eukprot:862746_1